MPSEVNPGVSQPVATNLRLGTSLNGVHQIRGTSIPTSTGAGIPKQVTNLTASSSQAVTGSSTTVTVTYQRDPSDQNFAGVNIYVKGYQGNSSLVRVGGGTNSPVNIVLVNTGEAISLFVQAYGNTGAAPVQNCPSTSVKLGSSSIGGFGTSSVTGFNPGNPGNSLPTGEPGDILRYNVNGDGAWDLVNPARLKSTLLYPDSSSSTTIVVAGYFQPVSGGINQLAGGGQNQNFPATKGAAFTRTIFSTAVASLNTIVGYSYGVNGNNAQFPILGWRRWSTRVAFGNPLTNNRNWFGLGCWGSGATQGTNSSQLLGTAGLAADLPNHTLIGFRYSNGLDTNVQAAAITAGAVPSRTIVDTGVPADTAFHFYEMALNATATSVDFFIDNKLVATISTSFPTIPTGNIGDDLCEIFHTVDNKNTATAVGMIWEYTGVSWI